MSGSAVSVIVSLTEQSEFATVAAALATQSHRDPFEVIVLAHPGTVCRDFPANVARPNADPIPVRYAALDPTNRGSSLNAAVRLAQGELLVFLGDDLQPTADWLQRHVDFHAKRPANDAIGFGAVRYSAAVANDPLADWLTRTQPLCGLDFGGRSGQLLVPAWFRQANTSIPASLLWHAGLFDDDLPENAVEDYELGLRLFRLNAAAVAIPEAAAEQFRAPNVTDQTDLARRTGQLLARLDTKYGAQATQTGSDRQLTSWQLTLRAWACAISDRLHSTAASREERWSVAILAATRRGYDEMRRQDRRQPNSQRRLSVPLPAHIEAALASGAIRWTAGGKRGGQLLYPFDTGDSELRETEQAGRPCLEVRNPRGLSWAYLRVDPIFAHRSNRATRLTCEVWAPSGTAIWIEYDSNDPAINVVPGMPGAFKRTEAFDARGRWQTLHFKLPDLQPQERINTGDFRIVCGSRNRDPFFLRSVEIIREAGTSGKNPSPIAALQKMGFPPTDAPRVSVVIPIHNHLIYTLQCLQSLAANPSSSPVEIIIVDDASTDGSAAALRSIPGLRVLELKTNLGFTGACRHGAAHARGEFILFLNNDTVAHPRWLDEMLAVVDAHPKTGAVGSRLIYPQTGKEQHIGIAYDDRGRPYHLDRDGGTALGPLNATWPVPAVTGACLLTPRALYEAVDGFDPLYDQECQDIDYCCKVAEAGYAIYYCGASVLLHYESITRKEIRWAPERDVKTFLEVWELDADGFQMHRRPRQAKAA